MNIIHQYSVWLLLVSTFTTIITVSDATVPDPVINFSASRTVLSANTMSIMLTWDEPIGNFNPVTSYTIMGCEISDNEGNFLPCPSLGIISTLPSTITQTSFNVSTMADYRFNIIAENINGSSMPSSNITVLRPLAPTQAPQIVNVVPVVPASILLNWTQPAMNDREAPLTGYAINFFIVDTPVDISVDVGLQTSHLQADLRPNTEYEVEISAVNLIGIGPSSFITSFSGEATAGPPLSLNVSNVGIEPDTFTVSWSEPSQPNGIITGYEIQYKTSSDLVFMSRITNGITTSINLTSLITDVEYTIQVRAINAAGPGNFTDPLTVLNVLSVGRVVITTITQNVVDGENSEYMCSLFGGSNLNTPITSQWSITLLNGTTIGISGNSSDDFILLPPHNSRLIIVRHKQAIFDGATITCFGGLDNFTRNITLSIRSLTCGIENGRCESNCIFIEGDVICTCPINETIVNDRICIPTDQLLYFTLYDEVYENASTFIHHPLYHPGAFQLRCYNNASLDSIRRWIFSTTDNNSPVTIDLSRTTILNITIDGVVVPVTFQATEQSSSVAMLQVSHVVPGIFVCQSNDFNLSIQVVTGGEPLLQLLPPLPVRTYGRNPFNVTVNGFDINRFGRTVKHIRSQSTFVIMYKSLSLSQRITYNFINNDTLMVFAPSEFFSTYDPNQNTSYFEIIFVAPSGTNASVSFSVEYFDIHGVILPSNRSIFAVGENLVLHCNTTPPDLPVSWERSTFIGDEFDVNLANDSRTTFVPPDIKTLANLKNLTLGDSGDYECFGTDPELAGIRQRARDVSVLPDTLILLAENELVVNLNDRGAYAVEFNTIATFTCFGILNDANIELLHSAVNLSSNNGIPSNNNEEIPTETENIILHSELPYGPVSVTFTPPVVDGNLTCQSRTSGREQSVYIGVASPPGVLAVPLFSTPFKRVLVGDSVQFSYLIALVNSSLNVTSTVFMTYRNSSNGSIENMKLLDQGKDVYTFNIPSATLSMDETIFILEFAGIQIQSSQVTLRVFEQPIYIYSDNAFDIIPNGVIVNDVDAIRIPLFDQREARKRRIINGLLGPPGTVVLICEVLPGYENPFWEVQDNSRFLNPVQNQTITNATGSDIATINVISSSNATILTILIPSEVDFPDELNGTYTCKDSNSKISSSLILTNTNPYLVAITPPTTEVNFSDPLMLSFQAAYNSDGRSNFLETLMLEQTDSNGTRIENYNIQLDEKSNNPQLFSITFPTAGGNLAGTFNTFISEPFAQVTVEVVIILPTLSVTEKNVTVLSSQRTVLECIPSNPDLSLQWVLYQNDGTRIPITFDERNFEEFNKRNIIIQSNVLDIELAFPYHNITITNADVSIHSGVYVCSIDTQREDPTFISRNITVNVLPACHGPTLSRGLLWPVTAVNDTAVLPCSEINPSTFRIGPNTTRKCLDSSDINEGRWDEVDITNCTTRSSQLLLTYSTYLITTELLSTQNITEFENEFKEQFDNESVNVMVTLSLYPGQQSPGVDFQVVPAVFIVELLPTSNSLTAQTVSRSILVNYNSYSFEEFSETEEPPELAEITPNDVCSCEPSFTRIISFESETLISNVQVDSCFGVNGPCVCNSSSCTCNSPYYAGNGTLCALDSDQDSRPDIQLQCTDESCQMDVCPYVFNPNQSSLVCEPIEGGCPMGPDPEFQITWPSSTPNNNVTNLCGGGTGMAFRYCDSAGNWQTPIVTNCLSFEYAALMQLAMAITPESANRIVANLASITASDMGRNSSILPLDLGVAIFVLDASLDIAEMNPDLLREDEFINNFADVYSNLLDGNNEPGYAQADRMQSQMVLETSERLAILVAKNLGANETRDPLIRDNIVISVELSNSDVTFPSQELLNKADITFASKNNASIFLPASLIQGRAINGSAPVANIIYRNLDRFLPVTSNNEGPRPASVVLSSQVTNSAGNVPIDDPVVLVFEYTDNLTNPSNPRCAFWNFSLTENDGSGGWDTTGVITDNIDGTTITCNSSHLTSFAVLVDVSGQSTSSEAESTALSIVSYIGCGISMFCLLIAIILLAVYRNSILKGIHNFIHLNLAVALFLALLVFVSGIETATKDRNACKVIAALLHYFFTAVFAWMLCEGIMLYFLLVKVFNTGLGQRKLFYLCLGWGLPVPIVAIAAGIAHKHYGTKDYCWISTSEGTIWAFVAPMLAIITINLFFMFMALRALYQSKRGHMNVEQTRNADVVKAILKATVILLPLLGTTWVFGLLAVNENLTVFAWIFTILNSLQGMFILFFHVLKNDKIWTKIKSLFGCSKEKYSVASTNQGSSTGYTGTKGKNSAIPSSLQNDSIHLHSVTDKPIFVHQSNSSILESNHFANHTFKPNTIPEEENTTNNNNSIFVETEDILDNATTVEATDYANEPMDIGPPINTVLPDVITIEVDASNSSKNDFRITTSHKDLTTPTLYNTTEDHSSQGNILSQNS